MIMNVVMEVVIVAIVVVQMVVVVAVMVVVVMFMAVVNLIDLHLSISWSLYWLLLITTD